MSEIDPAVAAKITEAINHVSAAFPDLKIDRVTFSEDGLWTYANIDGVAPWFGPEIDIGLLEDAQDLAQWGCTYILTINGQLILV